MPRNILLGGLVLSLVSMVLGATVFQGQVASAAQAVLPVLVTNGPAQAVPVREQGTVSVAPAPASKHAFAIYAGSRRALGPLNASLLVVDSMSGVSTIKFYDGDEEIFRLTGPNLGGPAYTTLPLTQPIPISAIDVDCPTNVNCVVEVFAVGS